MKLPGGKTLASARTHPNVRADKARPCGHTHSLPRTLPSSPPSLPPSPFPPSPLPYRRNLLSAQTRTLKEIFIFLFFYFFWVVVAGLKREKKISIFGFQSPRSPGFAGEATRRRRFFQSSSPSHPSKLYSSLGWLNSKVPKPFSPFSLRLIDVDGF
jgi:hypothetical protein